MGKATVTKKKKGKGNIVVDNAPVKTPDKTRPQRRVRLTPAQANLLMMRHKVLLGDKPVNAVTPESDPYQSLNLKGFVKEDVFTDLQIGAGQCITMDQYAINKGNGLSLSWIIPENVINVAGKTVYCDVRGTLVQLDGATITLENLLEDTININGSSPWSAITGNQNDYAINTRVAERFAHVLKPGQKVKIKIPFGDSSNFYTSVKTTLKDERGNGAEAVRLYDFSIVIPSASAQSNTAYAEGRQVVKISGKVKYVSSAQTLPTASDLVQQNIERTRIFWLGTIPASEVFFIEPRFIPTPAIWDYTSRSRGGFNVGFEHYKGVTPVFNWDKDGCVALHEVGMDGVAVPYDMKHFTSENHYAVVRCLTPVNGVRMGQLVYFRYDGKRWVSIVAVPQGTVPLPGASVELEPIGEPRERLKIDWSWWVDTAVTVLEIVSFFL